MNNKPTDRVSPYRKYSNSDLNQMVEKESGPLKFCPHHDCQGLYKDYYICMNERCSVLVMRENSRFVKVRGKADCYEFIKGSAECHEGILFDKAVEYCSVVTGMATRSLLRLVR